MLLVITQIFGSMSQCLSTLAHSRKNLDERCQDQCQQGNEELANRHHTPYAKSDTTSLSAASGSAAKPRKKQQPNFRHQTNQMESCGSCACSQGWARHARQFRLVAQPRARRPLQDALFPTMVLHFKGILYRAARHYPASKVRLCRKLLARGVVLKIKC